MSVTSGINPITVGKNKIIYTGTKVTPTKDSNGNKSFKIDIIQYDDAHGAGGRTIGTRDANNPEIVKFNDNLSDDLFTDANATEKIKETSQQQVTNVQKDVATTAADKKALNQANAQPNKAQGDGDGEEGDNQKPATKTSLKDAVSSLSQASAESAVGTKNSGFGVHVYPATLRQDNSGQDYLKFDMMKHVPTPLNTETFAIADRDSNRESIGTVVLPVPAGIQDGVSVGWSQDSLTPLQLAKANVALEAITGGVEAGIDELSAQVSKVAGGSGEVGSALAATIAGMASGAGSLLTRATGAVMNPNMELLFTGPNLRTFSFQFLLAPRNDKEAKTVIKILRFFKQGMSPIRSKSRLFLKTPHTFRLSYRNSRGKQHKYLNKFKECALQSFGVNYAPNGSYSTYDDGIMTAYQMSMTYSELTPIYNDDYGEAFPAEVGF